MSNNCLFLRQIFKKNLNTEFPTISFNIFIFSNIYNPIQNHHTVQLQFIHILMTLSLRIKTFLLHFQYTVLYECWSIYF